MDFGATAARAGRAAAWGEGEPLSGRGSTSAARRGGSGKDPPEYEKYNEKEFL